MPDLPLYTVAAVAAPVLVLAAELLVLRTGLLRTARYWLAVTIVLGFQVPVDGWLTKPGGTVVHYDEAAVTGVRAPLWFPVEDFGFGFALVTLTLLGWCRLRRPPVPAGTGEAATAPAAAPGPAHPAGPPERVGG